MKRRHGYSFTLFAALGLFGLAANASAQEMDPGAAGPLAVTRTEYTYGDTAFQPTGFPGPVEITASVAYPTDLPAGPYPLIVFLHGRHVTCFSGTSAGLAWPCPPPFQSIPSYRGYDYISDVLASWGHIVVSISANGINARDNMVFDLGMLARAELIQRHLDQWNAFNTTGADPFGTLFVGKVDLGNIGTMGHSRGGEGVVRHYNHNASLGSPYTIRAVFPLAPVDFLRFRVTGAALDVLLPYCDGDVSDLQGIHFFDDARYAMAADPARKHTTLVMGANHNFYNTVWTPGLFPAGASDDWDFTGITNDPFCSPRYPANGRLNPERQRGTGLAYIAGFFRLYIGGELVFLPLFKGDAPPPPSAMGATIYQSYHAPDNPALRRDVNRLLTSDNLTVNTLGGSVVPQNLMPYDLCGGPPPAEGQPPGRCLPPGHPRAREPSDTISARATSAPALTQLRTGWSDVGASWENQLPPGATDVSGYAVFQFRVGTNFADGRNRFGVGKDFSVVMTDGAGNAARTRVSQWSGVLYYPPGFFGPVPHVVLNTARIPLGAFSGIDLADVRAIQFVFDHELQGALLITDLTFAD